MGNSRSIQGQKIVDIFPSIKNGFLNLWLRRRDMRGNHHLLPKKGFVMTKKDTIWICASEIIWDHLRSSEYIHPSNSLSEFLTRTTTTRKQTTIHISPSFSRCRILSGVVSSRFRGRSCTCFIDWNPYHIRPACTKRQISHLSSSYAPWQQSCLWKTSVV